MTRKTTEQRYDDVFESGRSRSRAKSAQRAEPAASSDDLCEFVEAQVRQITKAVQLSAAPLVPVGERGAADVGGQCQRCEETDEPHIHGAKLYAAGKEIF